MIILILGNNYSAKSFYNLFSKDKNNFVAQSRIEWDSERIKKKSNQKKEKIEREFPDEQEI